MPAKLKTITLAILADTHIPDHAHQLPPLLASSLKEARVDLILHAGDACNWQVYQALNKIAPVKIVRGNRDWFFGMHTPNFEKFSINQVAIALAHGNHSILRYALDKWVYIRNGYNFERYYRTLSRDFPEERIIIFGHTHHQTAQWIKEQLFFNPGAAYSCKYNGFNPQYGLISITPNGEIRTELRDLFYSPSQ